MFRRLGWWFAVGVVLAVVAFTLKWWWPRLLEFLNLKKDTLEALQALVQLILWVGAAILGLSSWLLRRKEKGGGKAPENEDTKKEQALQEATHRYRQFLIDRYQYLEFKGMGVSDRVPLRLKLQDLYVPLKARMEVPEGETWARELKSAGRSIPEEDRKALGKRFGEPQPVLGLLEKHNGLIILGDPGAGKTTFLKHVALRLASQGDSNSPLPVLVPLSAYATALAEKDVRLDDFICEYFHHSGIDLPFPSMLKGALSAGNAMIMLDGLDEVKKLSRRETVVRRVVEFYDFHKKNGNKFLITSRIIGYKDVRPTGTDLVECTLEDFGDEEIKQFVNRWTQAIEKAARGETTVAAQEARREREELLEAVHRNPGVRRLAANPLLLTILALMKRQGIRLPDRRVELYDKYVETLLSSWNRARGLGRPPERDLDVVETVRILAPLALWMHEVNPGVGLVKHRELLEQLEALYTERGETDPTKSARQFLQDVREHSGLLLERGTGRYGFIHLTFEEYLAAVAIAQRGQQSVEPIVTYLGNHIGDDNWHEVTLLTIGYLGIVQQREEAAGAVVEELIRRAPGKPGQAVVLAGEAVADAWPGGVTVQCKNLVVQELLNTMMNDEKVKPDLRVAAGNALARLGDPRFRKEAWYLPDEPLLGFIPIPAGKFPMGSDKSRDPKAYDDELPQHEVELPTYYIARYPVTVAQFRAFVEDAGHTPENPNSLRGVDNHPVVYITWHDAFRYCEWLTEKLRAWEHTPEPLARLLRKEGWLITLPGEAEWEKAARGTDGRIYPWGNEPDPNRANYDVTGIGTTSPVGCFPGGQSPYGCRDMAGNVWEWTRSLWGEKVDAPDYPYPYHPDDGRENLRAPDRVLRVLRGGAFSDYGRDVRCAVRSRLNPDLRYRDLGFRVVLRPNISDL